MKRRNFLQTVTGSVLAGSGLCERIARGALPDEQVAESPKKIVLRSSWQTVNIGDIAHTPGMLTLLEKYRPTAQITLWPNSVDRGVDELLLTRFPNLQIARSQKERTDALAECDFFLHGSGPGIIGRRELHLAREAGKRYGIAGITLSDDELKNDLELLSGADFVFLRDTDSMKALQATGISGPKIDFGPDATFAIDLRDEEAAKRLMEEHQLEPGRFLCAVPRLRWTPYWEIHPERIKPNPERIRVNEEFAEKDHAKIREAITAWVRETGMKVLLTPEMTYAVPLLRPLLYDKLPEDVKPSVSVMSRYWITAEACSVYSHAAAVVSMEQHTPIMAVSAEVPAILVRQPTDTRKGRMWYDIGLTDWVFEVDSTSGQQIAEKVVEIGKHPESAIEKVRQARQQAHDAMQHMIACLPE